MRLLTQNGELREIGVWNWSLPAWVVTLEDGTKFNVCPSAGSCAALCYARNGTYLFPDVQRAHLRNLKMVREHLDGWTRAMLDEIGHDRFRPTGTPRPAAPGAGEADPWVADWLAVGGQAVRIHDAGDFFADDYLLAWLRIARAYPDVLFYAYTKEVSRFRRLVEPDPPVNFRWIYSLGGREDHLLDRDLDRHAEVFPSRRAIAEAGYQSQEESDLYAVTLPTTRVGIPANNIAHFRKKQGTATFGELQQARHTERRPGRDDEQQEPVGRAETPRERRKRRRRARR